MRSAPAARPALFLDRDGTLVADTGYLATPDAVELLPGVAAALVAVAGAGYLCIVITNQSGIGRGIYSVAAFDATEREIARQLGSAGATLDATYYCPHHPDAGCTCRKPGTALHREAIAVFGVDLARSWCIGDQLRDLQPALELGCRSMLVCTGQGSQHREAARALGASVVDDLAAGSAQLRHYLGAP